MVIRKEEKGKAIFLSCRSCYMCLATVGTIEMALQDVDSFPVLCHTDDSLSLTHIHTHTMDTMDTSDTLDRTIGERTCIAIHIRIRHSALSAM